jgi:limonene-1,2-epoxide hydrolase
VTLRPSRRQFLSVGVAAGAALAWPGVSQAADLPATEARNIQVVTDFCNLIQSRDMTKLASLVTDTVVYRLKEDAQPIVGRDAVVARIKTFFDGTDVVEIRILKSQAIGPVVINERIDIFEGPKKHWRFHLTGMFFVKDGKIQEWTDYVIPE